jgi:hypothetical protein
MLGGTHCNGIGERSHLRDAGHAEQRASSVGPSVALQTPSAVIDQNVLSFTLGTDRLASPTPPQKWGANRKPPQSSAYGQSAPMQFRRVSPQPAVQEVNWLEHVRGGAPAKTRWPMR